MTANDDSFELAYVGAVVPDREPFNAPPFSRSGNLYQGQMLHGLQQIGVTPSLILSFQHVAAFPRGRKLWVSGGAVTDSWDNQIELQGFPNITPLKQVWLGGAAFVRLACWSLRRRGRPRVIHAYNLTTPSGVFLWAAARLTGARFSASLNDVEVPGQTVPDRLLFRFDHWMHGFLIPRLDGRVVVADAIAADFAPDQHYLRLEGGVGDALVARTEDLRRPRKDGPGPFRVVAVGSLDEVNGFDLIVDAMKHLRDVDIVLDIAGYGPLTPLVDEAVKADPRIRSHGYLSLDKVLALYGDADLILVIRRTKSRNTRYFFPGKLMEALLSGTPVLATGTGHLEEEYGEWLYLLTDETSTGLASKLRELAAMPAEAHRDLARRARERMLTAKTWRSQAGKLVDYLRDKVVRVTRR